MGRKTFKHIFPDLLDFLVILCSKTPFQVCEAGDIQSSVPIFCYSVMLHVR